ncbi:cupin domain-containing protein [Oleiharenicola sp. Vm1]|uniref:cupin domain-containing protein n=1 Tax=Oleiharenicola sp. Vm1 TaxID=3398393 RepID=UPI0039F63CA2
MNSRPLSPETHPAEEVIRLLDLAPLPTEGGWFRRTAESALRLPGAERRACSAILFLVTPEGFSALHRVDAVETWCFHAGDPLELLVLGEGGAGRRVALGNDLAAGQALQAMVPAGAWQGRGCGRAGAGDWRRASSPPNTSPAASRSGRASSCARRIRRSGTRSWC